MTSPESRMPTQIDHYRFVRELGRGGMGAVFEAVDLRDNTHVAVKLLHTWLAEQDSSFRDRFEREAHIAALLRSPYTVRLLDFGVSDGTYYLVMEFVAGESVAAELKRQHMEPARALRIGIDVARALEEAAARGVVHRDIKPDNIMVTADGRVKVTDFGIARQEGGTGLTVAGGFVGTADFAAPEQAAGGADHRTDIYSLGATLYCMLAGKAPYSGGTVWDVLQRHQTAQFPMGPLADLPDAVTNPIRRCMEKDPRDRYQSASELAGALERALAVLGDSARGRTGRAAQPAPATPSRPPAGTPTGDVTRAAPSESRPPTAATAYPPTAVESQATAVERPQAPGTPGRIAPATVSMAAQPLAPPTGDTTRYELVVTNTGSVAARFTLTAREPTGTLTIALAPSVTLAPRQSERLAMDVRQKRTIRGGSGRTQFQVAATRDDGSRAGFVNVMAPLADTSAAAGPGGGKKLLIGGALAAVAAAAAGGFFVLGSGGGDNASPTPGPPATAGSNTPGATASAGSIKVIDRWDFAFRITSNTCTFGAPVGDRYPISFRFQPASGSGTVIHDGDRVNVIGVQGGDRPIGEFTFRVKDFEIVYAVRASGGQTGNATIFASFSDQTVISAATLTERYEGANCEIKAEAKS
jgi:eukaryotic-like serine/threonine-protein kinase